MIMKEYIMVPQDVVRYNKPHQQCENNNKERDRHLDNRKKYFGMLMMRGFLCVCK